jgi:hypothetical protein
MTRGTNSFYLLRNIFSPQYVQVEHLQSEIDFDREEIKRFDYSRVKIFIIAKENATREMNYDVFHTGP